MVATPSTALAASYRHPLTPRRVEGVSASRRASRRVQRPTACRSRGTAVRPHGSPPPGLPRATPRRQRVAAGDRRRRQPRTARQQVSAKSGSESGHSSRWGRGPARATFPGAANAVMAATPSTALAASHRRPLTSPFGGRQRHTPRCGTCAATDGVSVARHSSASTRTVGGFAIALLSVLSSNLRATQCGAPSKPQHTTWNGRSGIWLHKYSVRMACPTAKTTRIKLTRPSPRLVYYCSDEISRTQEGPRPWCTHARSLSARNGEDSRDRPRRPRLSVSALRRGVLRRFSLDKSHVRIVLLVYPCVSSNMIGCWWPLLPQMPPEHVVVRERPQPPLPMPRRAPLAAGAKPPPPPPARWHRLWSRPMRWRW